KRYLFLTFNYKMRILANSQRINFLQPAHAPTAVGSALPFGFLPAGRQVRKFILLLLATLFRDL
ncbi:MAG: hypothetical protein AAB514_01415, partial [Patescibacteria group bacterium]